MATKMDELGSAILTAICAQQTAQFHAGRYTANGMGCTAESVATVRKDADEKTATMWRLYYEVASEYQIPRDLAD